MAPEASVHRASNKCRQACCKPLRSWVRAMVTTCGSTIVGVRAMPSDRTFAIAGGLISYGPNRVEPFRRAAGYLHRILKGERPSDLPVQAPTTYELVINLKTAKTLDLTVPYPVLAHATEVTEYSR